MIPVRLIGPAGWIDTYALVDSGSDDTIFDHELAAATGIEWQKGPSHEITGVDGGKLTVHFRGASYEVGGHRFTADLGFAPMPPSIKVILGQSGFFEKAIVILDQGNNRIEVKF